MPSKTKPRLSQESAEAVFWRQGGHCAVPDCSERARENHHVLSQQALRRWHREDLIDHPANIVQLCSKCHAGHSSGMHRLPRSICRHAEALDLNPSMMLFLDRFYGEL